jgi:hypothetical protein
MEAANDLIVFVNDGEISVTRRGTKYRAIYKKAEFQPVLVSRSGPYGPREFLSKAWLTANEKARELGWIAQ